MKIHLILCASKSYRDAAAKGKPYRTYAPTTLIHLAALVPREMEAEVRLTDLMDRPLPEDVWDADLIGISTLTCGAPGAYAIARQARQRGVTVVMGGSHPTLCPDEALNYADAVVVGYGEKSWPQLLHDFKNNKLQSVYRDFSNPFTSEFPTLNRKLYRRNQYLFRNCIETSRGCPNRCGFCVLKDLTGNSCSTRDIKDAVTEIETMGKEILFLDSSLTEFKEHTKKLWQELIPFNINWYGSATSRFGEDEEAVKLAARSGCKGVLIGFESLNQDSVGGTGKAFNQVAHYSDIIKRLHDNGLSVLGCFVFGFDEDDPGIFEKTVEFVNATKIDIVKYAILTPLPGTSVFKHLREEKRIISEDWALYDTEHVVYRPAGMSVRQLEEGCKWAFHTTYSYKSILKRIMRKNPSWFYSILGNLGFKRIAERYFYE